MNDVTTTRNGFRTEDITFKNARRQSAIDNEIERPTEQDVLVKAPVSLTPEQVTDYFKTMISVSSDSNAKRVYAQAIRWIDELQTARKKLIAYAEKEELAQSAEESVESID